MRVAMRSPLGPLMENTFMCTIEEKLESEDKLPSFCKRYVDDTLAAVKDIATATTFLATLNGGTPSNQLHDGSCKQQRTNYLSSEWSS